MGEEMFEKVNRQKIGDLYSGEGRCRVESEMVLPDYKEEAQKVIRIDPCARVNSKNIYVKGQEIFCEIEGVVSFNFLYRTSGEKEVISSFLSRENFTYSFKIPKPSEEFDPAEIASFVELSVEGENAKLQGPRKISARCDVSVFLDIKWNRSICLLGEADFDDIVTKCSKVKMARITANHTEEMNFSETIVLPKAYLPIKEVCEMDVNLFAQNVKAEDGGVTFTGFCDLHCGYTAEGEEDYISFYQPIEFEKKIGIPSVVSGNNCKVQMIPNFLKASTDINEEGENKNILFEISFTLEVTSFENQECTLIEDAFSTETELNLKRENDSVEELVGMKDFSVTLKESVPYKNSKKIFRAEGIKTAVDFKDCYLDEDKIVLEGKLFYRYLGMMENGEIENFDDSLDFHCQISPDGMAIPNGKECRIEVYGLPRSLDIDPDDEGLRLRFDLTGMILVFCKHHISPVVSAERGDEIERESDSILYVFPEEGESLWSLSKKYHISPEKLKEENRVEDEKIPSFLRIIK